MSIPLEQIALIGFILGPVLRTFYDFFLKYASDPIVFDPRYLGTMVASILASVISGIVYAPTVLQSLPEGSDLFVFVWAISSSFALNHVVNGPATIVIKRNDE